jgi:hypothetical protein
MLDARRIRRAHRAARVKEDVVVGGGRRFTIHDPIARSVGRAVAHQELGRQIQRETADDTAIGGVELDRRGQPLASELGLRPQEVRTIGVGPAGTYVLGLSLQPRELRMEGKAFNAYLRAEGVLDVLAGREKAGELEQPSRERYSKHVKALLQVGDSRSDVSKPLGYPAEIVPLGNPYALGVGAELELLCLVDGVPAAGVNLIAGSQPRAGALFESKTFASDGDGRVRVPILATGKHFAKFIRMVRVGEAGVDYESKWATLTFEVR